MKYIKYLLKRNLIYIIIVSSYTIWLYLLIGNNFIYKTNHIGDIAVSPPNTFLTIISLFLCTFTSCKNFSFKMKKINVDQIYSLPINKKKLFLTHLIYSFIEVSIILFINFIVCLIDIFTSPNLFAVVWFFLYFIVLLILSFSLIIIFSFFYTRGNTIYDGMMNVIFSVFFLVCIFGFINNLFDLRNNIILYVFPYSGIIMNDELFSYLMCKDSYTDQLIVEQYYKHVLYSFDIYNIITPILHFIGSIPFLYLFIKLNIKEKPENTMQVSRSLFSYRFFLPFYSFFITYFFFTVTEFELVYLFIFVLVGIYCFYMIYNRSPKIKKNDLIILITSILVGFIVSLIKIFIVN